ncbi:hypothetical protein A6P54_12990 [Bacillus sp. MKU004]|nr:hypothetical protein A6P54_12990 [Bacillus sp. MKU004]
MLTGWHEIQNHTYFFYSNGEMAANTVVDGKQLGSDGKLGGIPDSVELQWTDQTDGFTSFDFNNQGYKGINHDLSYDLLDSTGKILYSYKSPFVYWSKLAIDGTAYLLEKPTDEEMDLIALDLNGKVKWRKELDDYSDILIHPQEDGAYFYHFFHSMTLSGMRF